MNVTQRRTIDLSDRTTTPYVNAVQGDSGRLMEVELKSGGKNWTVPENTRALIRYIKPDGTEGCYDTLPDDKLAYEFEGNVLKIVLAPQVCTAAGLVLLQVCLMGQQEQISTFTMEVRVQQEVAGADKSCNYINLSDWLKSRRTEIFTAEDMFLMSQLRELKADLDQTTQEAVEAKNAASAVAAAVTEKLENGEFHGASAYELALENGFHGSLEEWIASLEGPAGEISREEFEQHMADSSTHLKVATGSYVGTGEHAGGPLVADWTYPGSLTFDFVPRLIVIGTLYPITMVYGCTATRNEGIDYMVDGISGWGTNTISWENSEDLNIEGRTYRYVAIG